jgi:hypothetical protein
MMNKLRGKWLCGAIAATALAGLSGQAMAARAFEIVDFFYTDDAHTGQYVGKTIYACSDQATSTFGHSTPFVVVVQTDCVDNAPAANANNALPTTFHNCILADPTYGLYSCSG